MGIPAKRILKRYQKNWSPQRILSPEKIVRTSNILINFNNKTQNIYAWAKEFKIPTEVIFRRYKLGLPLNEVFSHKRSKNKEERIISFQGENLSVKDWSEKIGLSKSTINDRLRKGLSGDELFSKKNVKNNKTQPVKIWIEIDGINFSIKDISKKYDIKEETLLSRYHKGYSIDKLILKKISRNVKKPIKILSYLKKLKKNIYWVNL